MTFEELNDCYLIDYEVDTSVTYVHDQALVFASNPDEAHFKLKQRIEGLSSYNSISKLHSVEKYNGVVFSKKF